MFAWRANGVEGAPQPWEKTLKGSVKGSLRAERQGTSYGDQRYDFVYGD